MVKDYIEYAPDILDKLHCVQLDMLKDFCAFCEQNNLKYFVHYGCIIGAVRHKGFIPWDDDIDLSMLRADYERFIELARADHAYSEKYDVLAQDCKNYPLVFAKISKKGTLFLTQEMQEAGLKWGINLDIFPLDTVPEDPKQFVKRARKAWIIAKLLYLYYFPHPHIAQKGMSGRIIALGCVAAHWLLQGLPFVQPEVLHKKYLQICCEEERADCQYVDYYMPQRPATLTMSYHDIYPTVTMPFENTTIEIPNQYDRILREKYGDYMQLPPVEKRKNHAPEVLDFGDE